MKRISQSQAGFSLIELAIALVIIGLVIGGVLFKGGDLIESARLKNVLSQVNEIRLAVATFQDRYQSLPGDYDEASLQIKDGLTNGKNNGVIDGKGLAPDSEAFHFWSHLASADLISDPGQAAEQGVPGFGHGAPASKIGGGFTIQYEPESMPGHWIILGATNGQSSDGALLTPLQAIHLDQKADDGNPKTGKIRARQGKNTEEKCLTDDGHYNTKVTKPACIVYFQLQ